MQPPSLSSDIALFLDFDGTLVPIAPTPDSIMVPSNLSGLLARLQGDLDGALAIVSGRELADVFQYLSPYVGPGAGSHGLELSLSHGAVIEPDEAVRDAARAILSEMQEFAGKHDGLLAEKKSWSASLHYRNNPALAELCFETMQAAVAAFDGWEVTQGKMVVEARPKGVSKASAVRQFMQQSAFKGRVPVFIGDDVTDEDGMRAAIELGGYGVKVGAGTTVAQYRLESPAAVIGYLENTDSLSSNRKD